MNNLWSQKCSELRNDSQYKLSIMTSLEQREIADTASFAANETVCKLPKQLSTVITVIKFQKAFFIHKF